MGIRQFCVRVYVLLRGGGDPQDSTEAPSGASRRLNLVRSPFLCLRSAPKPWSQQRNNQQWNGDTFVAVNASLNLESPSAGTQVQVRFANTPLQAVEMAGQTEIRQVGECFTM